MRMRGVALKRYVITDHCSIDELASDDAVFTNCDFVEDLSSVKDSRSGADPNTRCDPAIVIDLHVVS